MRVRELCKRLVITIDPRESVLAAAKKMREHHVGDVFVTDPVRGTVIGVVTDRDLVVGLLAKEVTDLARIEVRDIMRTELVTATEDEDVDEVLRRMRQFAVRRVPVLGLDEQLTGVLAIDDIIEWLREELSEVAAVARRQRHSESVARP